MSSGIIKKLLSERAKNNIHSRKNLKKTKRYGNFLAFPLIKFSINKSMQCKIHQQECVNAYGGQTSLNIEITPSKFVPLARARVAAA